MEQYKMYLAGEWQDRSESLDIVNPATGGKFATVPAATVADVDIAVKASQEAMVNKKWKYMDPTQRGRILQKMVSLTYEHADELAKIESTNQGKTFRDAKSDIKFAAWTLEYFAGWADKIEGKTIDVPGNRLDYTLRQPLGVTGHIIPWNFPFQLGIRSIAPALAAGCTVIAKPASLTPLSLLHWARVVGDAGLPDNVLQVITGSGSTVGDALVGHDGVDGISLTGSVETGVHVMKRAADNITPVTLELGGKGANIIFPDANLKSAIGGAIYGIFWNTGQMCWAGSRLLVHEDIENQVLDGIRANMEKWKIGPGLEEGVRMGPMVSEGQRQSVMQLTQQGIDQGAEVFMGGGIPDDQPSGFFINPTILKDVAVDNVVAQEEIFGPVLSVITFSDDDDALQKANQSDFGLLNGVWTNNLSRAHTFARELQSGMVSVNEFPITFPQTPFIGWKKSGIGQEQGEVALNFYSKTKNVNINLS